MISTTRRLAALVAATLLLGGCRDVVTPPSAAPPAAPLTPPSAPRGVIGAGSLQWFGYVDGGKDTYSLNGQDSYTNFGFIITDGNASSGYIGNRVTALTAHGQKAIVELGQLLWCPAPTYHVLCADPEGRIRSWKAANPSALVPGRVLAWIVRDEPFISNVSPADWQRAAKLVRDSLPGPKILLIEWAGTVADPNSAFNRDTVIKTVDWVGVDLYAIHPQSNATLTNAIANLKTRFPGRGIVYVGDGFFASPHISAFGNDINVMQGIAREWYDLARSDPAAVLFGFFDWENAEGGKGSRNFPPYVLLEHTRIGREITGRTRSRAYLPTGLLNPVFNSGSVTGFACDPDAAWGETVRVEFLSNGQMVGSATADRLSGTTYPECRSGTYRHFSAQLSGQLGSVVTAVAYDLDGGSAAIPALPSAEMAWVQPSGVSWGPPNTLTAAGWARNGSGGVALDWRDVTFSSNPAWNRVSYQPAPNPSDATWSNTIPVSNYCHTYQARAVYQGSTSPVLGWYGPSSGFCTETARMIWIQPASTAGFGTPGSLVVAGEAKNAPAGTLVSMWYRDVTAGGSFVKKNFDAGTDANGIWLNDIPNADPTHQYAVYAKYDVVTTGTCTYAGGNNITWC
jgi:hypothetical protein